MVATTMVGKLNLNTEKHPRPYKLSWLRKGNEVQVDKKCLVQFSIGPIYKDEVWCDVVPMDACHLLLGRPWQFDRRFDHDGYKKTYTFQKDGAKIILGPAKETEAAKSSEYTKKSEVDRRNINNNLLSRAEFLEELQGQRAAFMLVILEAPQGHLETSPQLQSVFDKFKDVVTEEIPPGLPPMRDIQHHIDFVPGAVIPNKAAYRMNPKEFEELQR